MKIRFSLYLLVLSAGITVAQKPASKPVFEPGTFTDWTEVRDFDISSDGKYAWYTYTDYGNNVCIISTDGKIRKNYPGISDKPVFISKGRLLFIKNDTLCIYTASNGKHENVGRLNGYKLVIAGKEEWLAYHYGDSLFIKSIGGKNTFRYGGVTDYYFNPSGSAIVINKKNSLIWFELAGKTEKIISHLQDISSITFDKAGKQLAFLSMLKSAKVISLYQEGMDTARVYMQIGSKGIPAGSYISDAAPEFSNDGLHLYFKLEEKMKRSRKGKDIIFPGLDIWHYNDADVQSHQLEEKLWEKPVIRTAVSLISSEQVDVLEKGDTLLLHAQVHGLPFGHYVITKTKTVETEAAWHPSQTPYYNLIEIATGKRIPLPGQPKKLLDISLSPGERYVTWSDTNHIWSYEIATGISRNLTKQIPVAMLSKAACRYDEYYNWAAFQWIADDQAFLAWDKYDVWQLDPAGIKEPINLTAGYGRKNNISFQPITSASTILNPSQQYILAALDNATKDNGFWTITLGKSADPRKKTMDDCIYYFPGMYVYDHIPPVKAANAESYILLRERENEPDNLFATKDFKTFVALSEFAPHKKYNWYTTELITWKTFDGSMNQGILYKPEDFDSTRKYPLIFTYYEKRTNELNHFMVPQQSSGILNVAAYASSGYLVFVPDIIRPSGQNARAVLNVVESAVKHLSQFSWINTKKLGIQGQSFGGYITNILATRSNLFAAAQASCGVSDITAGFGGTSFGGMSSIYITERGQVNMGTTPWEDPGKYIENSPVYYAGKCTTPLLLMHNKNDIAVPFTQGLAMYMALRRQNKPVWLLQYDGEGHVLLDNEIQKDFTKRQRQFFDHYLRDQPAPLWMTNGVDAKDKGKISGFELQPAARK